MISIISILFIIIFFELLISIWIKKIEISKWILTEKNLYNEFDKKKFNKFKKLSYDEILGWDQKKSFVSYDTIGNKKIFYKISNKGYRKSKNNHKKNLIASFGDSYVFSRQVGDSQTWQEYLSRSLNIFVSNYGVGNYGLDQAYLKFLKTKISKKTKIIIFGFVPETICRIQSIWKNYLEFGNIHGFKPHVNLKNRNIIFETNYLKKNTKLKDINLIIDKIKKRDRFYERKFKKRIFKFPHLLSFLKNLDVNTKIFFSTFKYIFKRKFSTEDLENKIFPIIMSKNIDESHNLYKESYSKELLFKMMLKINQSTSSKKRKVFFVIFPQLHDLEKNSNVNYQNLFKSFSIRNKNLKILDLTSKFIKKNYNNFFNNDKYGGHLNAKGNKFVAKEIKKIIDYENYT